MTPTADVPDGVPPALRVKDAAAVLRGFDERTLARWCSTGFVVGGFQPTKPNGAWWIPAQSVAELAVRFRIVPAWEHAL
jgi:hypothetical protein